MKKRFRPMAIVGVVVGLVLPLLLPLTATADEVTTGSISGTVFVGAAAGTSPQAGGLVTLRPAAGLPLRLERR